MKSDILDADDESKLWLIQVDKDVMESESANKKEEEQPAAVPIHTAVETPQDLVARLAEEEKEIQVLALTWDTEGGPGYCTAEAIKIMDEKGLNDRQIFIYLKKKWKTKACQEKKKVEKAIAQPAKVMQTKAIKTSTPVSAMVSVGTGAFQDRGGQKQGQQQGGGQQQ
uniref:Uncharacterized protein n=1 Tax=Romanomermis culicivorax TaxID=13658 RepID=A0A915JQ53_ROMCU